VIIIYEGKREKSALTTKLQAWLFSLGVAMMFFFNRRIAMSIISTMMLFCIVTSIVCYTKIYLTLRNRQAQVQENTYQGETNGGGTSLNVE